MAEDRQSEIAEWCRSGKLPTTDKAYATLIDENDRFTQAEGNCWDFKDEWPFSLSNEYFGGIARLACAFANMSGGVIIFGVHDKHRTGGHNKVNISLDAFRQAFVQLTGARLAFQVTSYTSDEYGDIDILLVPARPVGVAPLRFKRQVGKYQPNLIWGEGCS